MNIDHITTLESVTGTRLTKIIGPEGAQVAKPGTGTDFFVKEHPVSGLADLHTLLVELAPQPGRAIILDRLTPGLSFDVPHRRNGRKFDDVPHYTFMLDCDGIEAPPGTSPTDPYAVEWLIKTYLPPEFWDASYIIQFSSSAGTAKAGRKIKVHLWFWLVRPARSSALKEWAKSLPCIDPSVYGRVHIHYTADPIHQGCADPLPGRRILFVRKEQEAVALALQDAPRGRFAALTAAPTAAPVQDSAGKLTDGREA